MSFNAWPDHEAQADKLVGHDAMLSSRPSVLEPLVPTPASEISAESLSRALSAAISSHELLIGQSSSVGSDELMRATVERRDAMSMVRAELDRMPRDALLTEPMIRQRYPSLPGWLPTPFHIALGGEMSTLGAGIAEHAAAATQPVLLEPAGSQQFSSVMQTFGERVAVARTRSEGGARSASGILSAAASLVGLRFERRSQSPLPAEQTRFSEQLTLWIKVYGITGVATGAIFRILLPHLLLPARVSVSQTTTMPCTIDQYQR